MRRPPIPEAHVLNLDAKASALLDLLVDLGHLDEAMLSQVNDQLLDLDGLGGDIPYDQVRRVVAQIIFEHVGEMDPEYQRMVDQEWGLLFH